MPKPFAPNLHTAVEDFNKTEIAKQESNGLQGDLHDEYRNDDADITWETEQLSKSYGIYLEFNRAKTGKEKDWMYMIRIGIPGGGPISPKDWALLDDLAEQHGKTPEGFGSLRLTTRAAIQYHWINKAGVLDIVKRTAEADMLSLNGCGDNVRNVLSSPLGAYNPYFDGTDMARELARYFRLPEEPFLKIFAIDPNIAPEERSYETFKYGPNLLNRKFKIAVSSLVKDPVSGDIVGDNCVELRTHDLGIAPLWENGAVNRFQIYIGGGQGEKYGKTTAAALALPLGVVDRERLFPALDAVVAVHQEWGDRQNRHWARLKYVVKAKGIDWYRQKVAERTGFELEPAIEDHDVGRRFLHHGWYEQPDGRYTYGAFIENGRLIDNSLNGRLKSMVREVSQQFDTPLTITPNQDLLFHDIAGDQRDAFLTALQSYGYGKRNDAEYSALRLRSGACVGRDTCRLAYTDSEKFEPFLIDDLEKMGWGHLQESIGITGCERQCFRPGTKTLGLVGSGNNRYQFKFMGSEDARHQGRPLREGDRVYLRSVPRDRVPQLIDILFKNYEANRQDGEDLGAFHRRMGDEGMITFLKDHPDVGDLMAKTMAFEGIPEDDPNLAVNAGV